MNKTLTVSISCYNVEQYLHDTLLPFTKMRNKEDVEVLIDDNAATDNSFAIAREYESHYPGLFKCSHTDVNGSWGRPLNNNIHRAEGRYFKILDGDDYLDPDKLDLLIDFLKNVDVDIIVSGFATFNSQTKDVIDIYRVDKSFFGDSDSIEKVSVGIPLQMHSFTVKTELLKKNNITVTENRCYTDMEYTSKVILYAQTILPFDEVVYMYRLGRDGQSVSTTSLLNHIEEHAEVIYGILDASKKINSSIKEKLLYNLANGADITQYRIYLQKEPISAAKKELCRHDRKIKDHYPDYYKSRVLPLHVRYLIKTNFIGVNVVAVLKRIRRALIGVYRKENGGK